jgi:hypothetical protein
VYGGEKITKKQEMAMRSINERLRKELETDYRNSYLIGVEDQIRDNKR